MENGNKKAPLERGTLNGQENDTPSRKKTQEEKLFDEWAKGREIGQLEAIKDLGIGHLSSLISKMILKEGIKGIRKIPCVSSTGAHYTAYYMSEEDLANARIQYKIYKKEI